MLAIAQAEGQKEFDVYTITQIPAPDEEVI